MLPRNRSRSAPAARLSRPAGPSCRGGASSLLRLAQPGAARLPSVLDVGGWIDRAVHALRLPSAPSFAPSDFVA